MLSACVYSVYIKIVSLLWCNPDHGSQNKLQNFHHLNQDEVLTEDE